VHFLHEYVYAHLLAQLAFQAHQQVMRRFGLGAPLCEQGTQVRIRDVDIEIYV
jgi:hypothetical protein